MPEIDKITITMKGDGAPWIVVHASSPEEAEELLDATTVLADKAVTAALHFKSSVDAHYPARGSRSGGGGGPRGGGGSPGRDNTLTHIIFLPFNDGQGRQAIKDACSTDGKTAARWDADRKGWKVPAYVAEQFTQYKSEAL